jgi:UDP-N-acetylglucosamine:LPS N-acetylglucosamine transferase
VYVAQTELSAQRLDIEVRRLTGDPAALAAISAKAAARGRPHAAEEIASRIAQLLPRG